MAGRRKWIVVLSVILVLLLIVAGLCYVKGWSFTGNKDGADERERWQEVLSKEVLEQYDSGVSYKELVEEPEKYQQKDDCGAVRNGRGCLRRAGRKPAGGFPDRRRASDRLRRR